ncbi:hypothetical protein G3480_06485 [Thiorhodococcus mannitoliphagus]|uniref:Uncharacterized protein n=1 Tax=Thiorhodococcus mannitoliphagus TaxID=329406 RepID=A0A6P1DV80_9GAMM|nr:hypothetical protein [Thiorhodococcus mannitoliphagus]NEX19962.1 hypothetical protein [Thiorhodococcus mannitoliphagus]
MGVADLGNSHLRVRAAFLAACSLLLLAGLGWSAARDGGNAAPSGAARSVQADRAHLVRDARLRNQVAYVVPQCYVLPRGPDGALRNPCYLCHQRGQLPNYIDDSGFQQTFEMASAALRNPWSNLFEDRSERIAKIDDSWMRDYVRGSNYRASDGRLILAARLEALPQDWDLDQDGTWNGYLPDTYFRFDDQGFDLDPEGAPTGWRAFAYYPLPGTSWPTNGSAGDVLIRLADAFRRDADGKLDSQIYALNLAIVEALIKRADVAIDPADERALGVDLDKDGQLGTATVIRYDWAPLEGRSMSYVGMAAQAQRAGRLHLAAGLYPEGTELLQSLRYLDVDDQGHVRPAARMKELRYARKNAWYSYAELKGIADRENAERREAENDVVKQAPGDYERGLFAQGWVYQGFIEDARGQLRPQTQEETLYCMGCHGGIGVTTDTTFALARKLDSKTPGQGWGHWSQRDGFRVAEPVVEIEGLGAQPEYSHFLMATRSGSDFLVNTELEARFFDDEGRPRPHAFERLHQDISVALLPSPERAIRLNKAYRTIVEDQGFVRGREVNLAPITQLLAVVPKDLPTGIERPTQVQAIASAHKPELSSKAGAADDKAVARAAP